MLSSSEQSHCRGGLGIGIIGTCIADQAGTQFCAYDLKISVPTTVEIMEVLGNGAGTLEKIQTVKQNLGVKLETWGGEWDSYFHSDLGVRNPHMGGMGEH